MKLQILFSLILLPIFLSCKSQTRKSEAFQFLKDIDNVYDTLDVKGDKFVEYFGKVSLIAKANGNFQLDQKKLDSLRQFYADYLNAYDKGLQKLNTLNEYDDLFQLVSLNSQVLKNYKSSWMEIVPSYLKVFKSGWQDAGKDEHIIIESTASIMGKYQKLADDLSIKIEAQGIEFGKKYGFKYIARKFR